MDSQGYQDLSHYKEHDGTPEQIGRLKTLFALAMNRHSGCIIPHAQERPFGIASVPSTSGLREGAHPLETHIVSMLSPTRPRIVPRYVGPQGGERNARRILAPQYWELDEIPSDVKRVLVIDDSWVTGGHAQSVASAFEQKGVAARIIVLGRVLDPSRNDHGAYLRSNTGGPFDSSQCPVHRGSPCESS